MKRQKLQKTANQSSSSQSSVSTTNFILRQRRAGSSEKFVETWRLEVDRSREDGRVVETRETYNIDNEAARSLHEKIGRGQIPRKKAIQSSSIQNTVPTTGLIEYEEKGESSASIGEIGEEDLETTEPTENRHERVVFEMSSDRPRDFQSQRTRREEVSQTLTNTSNYPTPFKTNLILSILGGLSFAAFWFANRINKD